MIGEDMNHLLRVAFSPSWKISSYGLMGLASARRPLLKGVQGDRPVSAYFADEPIFPPT